MAPVLSVRNASKVFGGHLALDHVSLDIEPGEVRALVGQNGCGKSTLIKILAGFHAPEEGTEVFVDGRQLDLSNANASEQLGLRFVHQDLGMVWNMDAVDNMALSAGYATGPTRTIRWRKARARARFALAELGYTIDVRKWVGQLQMSERTAIAIARALSSSGTPARVLILDEPTANLPGPEASRLHELVRRVASTGMAVLFVSHHFDEVFEMADTVTVLRDGKYVDTRRVADITEDQLIELVIGRQLTAFDREGTVRDHGAAVLDVSDLRGHTTEGVSFSVHAGEVVGFAGITGSGREEVATLIFGGRSRHGEVKVDGEVLPPNRPDISVDRSVAMVPADRHANATLMQHALGENVTIVDPGRHWKFGILRRRSERADVRGWLTKLDVKPARPEYTMAQMSGGNQQKVIIARWLRQEPRVLILDEPTQGVDVGSKADIHRFVDEAAAQGSAVLVASSDHEELVRVCDRVMVLRRGKVVLTLSGHELTADRLTAATIGRDQPHSEAS